MSYLGLIVCYWGSNCLLLCFLIKRYVTDTVFEFYWFGSVFFPCSQHVSGIRESFRLVKILKNPTVSSWKPTTARSTNSMTLSSTSMSHFNISRDGDSTTSLGSPFRCLVILSLKKIPSVQSKPCLANLGPFCLVLTHYLGEEADPHLATRFPVVLARDMELSLLFSRFNNRSTLSHYS